MDTLENEHGTQGDGGLVQIILETPHHLRNPSFFRCHVRFKKSMLVNEHALRIRDPPKKRGE